MAADDDANEDAVESEVEGESGEPPRSAALPAGYDEDDPYEAVDLETYPDWWRENVELFREYGLRPYRPPRFGDGTLTTPLIERLEAELGVEIEVRSVNPHRTTTCEVVVNGERVATVERSRESDGHTAYDVTARAFEAAVRAAVGPDGTAGDGSSQDH